MSYSIYKYVGKKRTTWGYVLELGKDENGKRQQETKQGFKFERDAEAAAKAREPDLHGYEEGPTVTAAKSKKPQPRRKSTFADVLDEYLALCAVTCTLGTREAYRKASRYPRRYLGPFPITAITSEQLQDLFTHLFTVGGDRGKPLGPKTIKHARFLIKGVLDLAIERKYIAASPLTKFVRTPKVRKKQFKMPEKQHLKDTIQKARGRRLYPVLELKSATGARLSEVLAVQWPDFDPQMARVEISKAFEDTKFGVQVKATKSEECRTVELPPSTIAVLEEHRLNQEQDKARMGSDYDDQGYIFAPPQGGSYRPSNMSTKIGNFLRKHGLDLSAHGLRHAHGSIQLSEGAPIGAVSGWLPCRDRDDAGRLS
jgi:integrase